MWSRSVYALLLSCLSSALLGGLLLAYGYFIEPHWIEETHRVLYAEHWQGRPLRLAVIADLHARWGDEDYLDDIVERTLAAQPDAVLLLGDYTNDKKFSGSMDMETLGKHLAPLAQLPCFAVLGNHDYLADADAVKAMLARFGAQCVEGGIATLELGGDTLSVGGIRCLYHYDKPGEVVEPPQNAPVTHLLLAHSPSAVPHAPKGTTAVLVAHTHGGQICLPGGIPLLYVDRSKDWKKRQGIYGADAPPACLTRGLGMSKMPLRLFCRPELLFIELRGRR